MNPVQRCTSKPGSCLSEVCLCRYVREVLVLEEELDKKLQGQFITQQLCSMLAVFDLSDEVGK